MIPSIDYYRPHYLEELLSLLNRFKSDAKILAGGTDIIPGLQQGAHRFKEIKALIDVNSIPELKVVKSEREHIFIGAAATFSDIIKSALIKENFPLLVKAASGIGSVQIRNRATIAGNFINNAPCADSIPALLVYNAVVKIKSAQQEREMLLKDLLLGPYRTLLNPDEVVVQIKLPVLSDNYSGDYYKLGRRRSVAISRITLAILMSVKGTTIHDIRIASGAVTPVGMRFEKLEELTRGKQVGDELFKQLSQQMGEQILEVTGLRWSSAYKLPVIQQMFYQLLLKIQRASL